MHKFNARLLSWQGRAVFCMKVMVLHGIEIASVVPPEAQDLAKEAEALAAASGTVQQLSAAQLQQPWPACVPVQALKPLCDSKE